MIGKQVKGKSFRGVLNYLSQKEGSKLILKNMAANTPASLAKEFAISRQLNPRLQKAVYHSSLSLPKTESLNDHTWSAIADDYLKGMGFEDSQSVVYRHSDRDHDHIHIVASRIKITDGSTVNDSWDYIRSEKLIRELEKKYRLTPTISSSEKYQRGQTTGETRLLERTAEESVRTKLQQIITQATEKTATMPELVTRLKEKGIDTKISLTKTGTVKGISYKLDGVATSGTHLGKAFTFPGLQKHRQVHYDHNLNYLELIKANKRSLVTENNEEEQLKLVQAEQRKRSLIIAPILRDYINLIGKTKIRIDKYRISWQKEKKTLFLYVEPETKPRLEIQYIASKFKPVEFNSSKRSKPMLTNNDVNYWQQLVPRLNQMKVQKNKKLQELKKKPKRKGRRL